MHSNTESVLVAQSDPELAGTMARVLEKEGLSVTTALDGLDAVRQVYEKLPNLLVCSYYLPRLGGLRVCRFLKSNPTFVSLPILLVIPTSEESLEMRARWVGADATLELPFRADSFRETCGELIQRSRDSEPGVPPGPAPDRSAIMERLTEVMDTRINHLEAVRELAGQLGKSMSVRETFRKITGGLLTGLGFERVWVCRYVEETGHLLTEQALGRGLDEVPDVVELSEIEGLPGYLAITEGRQVLSRNVPIPKQRLEWYGSVDYVDTPLVARGRVVGLIRADFLVSGKSPQPEDCQALQQYSLHAASAVLNAMGVEKVSEGREQMASILGSLDSGVIVVDTSGTIVEATSRVKDLYGKAPSEMKGRLLVEAIPVLARDDRQEILREVLSDGESKTKSEVVIPRSGSDDVVQEIRFVPYRRGGHISGAVIVVNDVTREHALREDLRKRNEELETISRIGRKLNSTLDLEEISTTLVRTIRQFHPDEAVAVLLPDLEQDTETPSHFVARATAGYQKEYDPLGARLRLDGQAASADTPEVAAERSSIVGVAVRTAEPVNVADVTQDSRFLRNYPGIRSEIAIPMVVRERVVGVIDIQSPVAGRFDPDSIRRVTTLANHAATAVENAQLHSKVWEMAQRDRLTGLRNLRFFEDRLKEELDRATRYDYPLSLIMMDIDDFKHYNDSFGHPMGNVLLRKVASAIRYALRDVDILVRYGGEEFVCLLPMTGEREAAEIAERIRRKVLQANDDIPHASEQPRQCVSVSLGVSTFLTDVQDREKLLDVADQRMYAAKKAGKNQVCASALGNCPPME
ncbi:diguanylate cyclase [Candidatus Fermentibacteria bacterium]|nr:diguanylate cyclase [Candidatus Fermentibacteria bacterium]